MKVKKIISFIGIVILGGFSFYYTDKVVDVIKLKDPLMTEIFSKKDDFEEDYINAKIEKDYIKSGLFGIKVDVEKSYDKMKKLGYYNENLYVFIKELPEISIANSNDKFIIGGNEKEKEIALIFTLNNTDNLSQILAILNNEKASFFIDGKAMEEEYKLLSLIKENGHFLGNLGYDGKYSKSTIKYTNALINKYQNTNMYCYVEDDNYDILKLCSNVNMYTIKPYTLSKFDSYSDLKNNLNNGGMYSLNITGENISTLKVIVNYIKQRGYSLLTIEELLSE